MSRPRAEHGRQYILDRTVVDEETGCWVWQLTTTRGYGSLKLRSSGGPEGRRQDSYYAHRYAYQVFVGEVGSAVVHHKCANKACCNPDHLQLTTHHDNNAEMWGRKAYEDRIAELEQHLANCTCRLQDAA